MGYELHITRKTQWFDEDGPTISPEEWLSILDTDPELSRADAGDDTLAGARNGETIFWFTDGEVRCKNPDQSTIRKMVAMADQLGAKVQGDDGEIYREDGSPFPAEPPTPPAARPGILARIGSWFRHRRDMQELQQAAPSFRESQRVKNAWGELGTVLSVDRNANGGLGSFRVRLDDGREVNVAQVASGMEIVGNAAGEE